ncbi:mechanosensitive ion channel [Lysobacter sp. S4-A87]|uniref:mechanosensitive ion channel family protein n=1 Tax=Lysobacter sp. S4-A87 TaxID=2925843 RepID=UPI001F5336AD|nr:mechanosensitive ion channel domain-containing protein [Lysobacter sp. S4-A87]UNK49912.1 mechanosensitive ion channel [Lysobacter sp. S4-A87]
MEIQVSVASIAAHVAPPGGADKLRKLFAYEPLDTFGWGVSIGNAESAIVAAVAVLALSALLQALMKRYAAGHEDVNKASLYTLSRLLHYTFIVIAALVALHLAGIPLNQLALFCGALGVGLGFGLQAIFSNFISGLILLFDRSLKVGDFVALEGDIRGIVRSINIRATRITTNDNIDVLVPNSEFVTKRLVNWTHGSENRRIRVPFSVAPDVDKELVKKAALEAASNVPFTLAMEGHKQPQVWLEKFGDSSSDFTLAVWLTEAAARRNAAIRAAYLWELDTALRKYGIANSLPQLEVHLRSMFDLKGGAAVEAMHGKLNGTASPPAEAPATLASYERANLSRNDAQEDAQRQIQEEAQRSDKDGAMSPSRE